MIDNELLKQENSNLQTHSVFQAESLVFLSGQEVPDLALNFNDCGNFPVSLLSPHQFGVPHFPELLLYSLHCTLPLHRCVLLLSLFPPFLLGQALFDKGLQLYQVQVSFLQEE